MFNNVNYNKRFVILEGLPGGGKTTLLKRLESVDIYTINQILPHPKDDDQLTLKYIQTSDSLKTEAFFRAKSRYIIADRYYVSTLAYHWSYDKVFHTKTYNSVYKWYQESLKKGSLVKPFITFLIVVPSELSLVRKSRVNDILSQNPWVRNDFLNYVANYYSYFYKSIEPETRVISIDGTLSLVKIKNIIKNEIYKS